MGHSASARGSQILDLEGTMKRTNTGILAIPEKYWQAMGEGKIPCIPKSVLQKYGCWLEHVESLFSGGFTDGDIRRSLVEIGCKATEIKRYFAQFA